MLCSSRALTRMSRKAEETYATTIVDVAAHFSHPCLLTPEKYATMTEENARGVAALREKAEKSELDGHVVRALVGDEELTALAASLFGANASGASAASNSSSSGSSGSSSSFLAGAEV